MPQNYPQMDEQGRLLTATQFVDETGTTYTVKQIDGKPRVSSMPYLYDIAEGNVADHAIFAKLGYNGDIGCTERTDGMITDIIIIVLLAMIWFQGTSYSKRLSNWFDNKRKKRK